MREENQEEKQDHGIDEEEDSERVGTKKRERIEPKYRLHPTTEYK